VITALVRDKIKILLLERDEVSNIRNTQDLANLLKRKILALTLRRAVYREPAPAPAPAVVDPEPEQPV
jgi:hypothetical protein